MTYDYLDSVAREIFTIALRDDRAGELLDHLFGGGAVTIDPHTHELILVPAALFSQSRPEDLPKLAVPASPVAIEICAACNGNGGGYVSHGPDNWDWEPCEPCRAAGSLPVAP